MIKSCIKSLPVILILIHLQFGACGQNWTRISLDSVATIEFPAKPISMGAMGARRVSADCDNGVYSVIVAPIGFNGNSLERLERSYKYSIHGAVIFSDPASVIVTDFKLNRLLGKDVVHHLGPGRMMLYYHTRLLNVNGTNYSYQYCSEDSATLFSPDVNRFLTSFSVDTTIQLKQYGLYQEGILVKRMVLAWKVFKVWMAILLLVFISFLVRSIIIIIMKMKRNNR